MAWTLAFLVPPAGSESGAGCCVASTGSVPKRYPTVEFRVNVK